LRYVGLGKETVYGSAVAASCYSPVVASLKPDLNWIIPVPVADRSYRKKVMGNYRARGNIGEFEVDPEGLIGYLLLGVFGKETVTVPDTGVYIHTFKSASTLPSFTARLGVEVTERVAPGVLVESLTLRFSQGQPVKAQAEIYSGFPESKNAINSSPAFSTLDFFTQQNNATSFTIGGVESGTLIYDLEVTIKNNIPFNLGDLSGRTFSTKRYGQREVTGKVSLYFEDTEEMDRFLSGAEFTLAASVAGATITGAHKYGVGFDLRKCVYLKDAVPDITNISEGLKIVNAPFQAFYDSGLDSEASATLQNTISTY